MKKGLKKQIERELTAVIEKTLSGHNKGAIAKTKKTIKEASKSVGKKFLKTLKTLAEKKKGSAKAKKKDSRKAKPAKAVASAKVKTKKRVRVRHAPRKVTLPAPMESNGQTSESILEQN